MSALSALKKAAAKAAKAAGSAKNPTPGQAKFRRRAAGTVVGGGATAAFLKGAADNDARNKRENKQKFLDEYPKLMRRLDQNGASPEDKQRMLEELKRKYGQK
jgi:hypothetical protein